MAGSASEDAEPHFEQGPVRVIFGQRKGAYPDGNSILVRGENESLLIDPAVGLHQGADRRPEVDRVLLSHCHEDHIAGLALFPETPVHLHALDRPGLDSLDDMLAIYGYGGPIEELFRTVLVDTFHYAPRPDAQTFVDGDVFDAGGVTVRMHHAPGHTRGHTCMMVEWTEGSTPRRLLYLGDIELTGFGPYYGDQWSNLEDFERSLQWVRGVEADWYATFHHIGVLGERAQFLERLDLFEAAIARRENALLEFLAEPRNIEDVVEHRFVYRPSDDVSFADAVERRSMQQHLDRLAASGRVLALPEGRYQIA
ncbi:MAG: MBL fold metallo-hydrolase [Myxococcota bacterium]|jgi:glyoxylase-like metal-dependent hydrolase (beta-lactamase superfamily II)|nr:MBL fold metallo-hydrolase [Myxococcota bacterium]